MVDEKANVDTTFIVAGLQLCGRRARIRASSFVHLKDWDQRTATPTAQKPSRSAP